LPKLSSVKEVFKRAGTPQWHMGSPEVASLFSEHDIVGLQKVASSSSIVLITSSSSLVLLLFEVEMGDKLQKETCSLSLFLLFLFFFLIVFPFSFFLLLFLFTIV
jgi:hypothetical protein